jgi:hypothetical protein
MMYETEDDLKNEDAVAAFLIETWQLADRLKLSIPYGLDYALIRQGRDICAFCEVKCRPGLNFGQGDGYYLSLQKAMRAREITLETGLPCGLVVRFSDGVVASVPFTEHLPGCIVAGRSDRNNQFDKEPHVIFPWDKFTVLS